MNPTDFDDAYSVSPKNMSDEQIARRDAMSTTIITEEMQAESSRRLEESFAGLAASALAIKAERDALRAVLREIVNEYENTYEGELHGDGRWTDAASIPVAVMERAMRLVKPDAPAELFAACTCDGVNECEKCKTMRESK